MHFGNIINGPWPIWIMYMAVLCEFVASVFFIVRICGKPYRKTKKIMHILAILIVLTVSVWAVYYTVSSAISILEVRL